MWVFLHSSLSAYVIYCSKHTCTVRISIRHGNAAIRQRDIRYKMCVHTPSLTRRPVRHRDIVHTCSCLEAVIGRSRRGNPFHQKQSGKREERESYLDMYVFNKGMIFLNGKDPKERGEVSIDRDGSYRTNTLASKRHSGTPTCIWPVQNTYRR